MTNAYNDQSSVPKVKGVVERIPVELARPFYWSSYHTPTGPEITASIPPDKGFQETLDGGAFARFSINRIKTNFLSKA